MEKLKVSLQNCYGIKSLQYNFDFQGAAKSKAYAVYAPNGSMKTSFSKTFDALANEMEPKEERFNRPSCCTVEVDELPIRPDTIYVLKSEIDIRAESTAITNVLVDPENKARYDELLIDLEKHKSKLLSTLQKMSGIKKQDVERTLLHDWGETDFASCIQSINDSQDPDDLSDFTYNTIFNDKTLNILKSSEFLSKSAEFTERYDEVFQQSGTIYKKGVFNPPKAEAALDSLKKQGFFQGGHRVHLEGDEGSIDEEAFAQKLNELNRKIDEDEELRRLRLNLAKNAQTQALIDLIEELSSSQVDYLLENLKPENQEQFRRSLWAFYVKTSSQTSLYLSAYLENRDEIETIEADAAGEIPHWQEAVDLFNYRFIDMPFRLAVINQSQVVLGKQAAELRFVFREGEDSVEWSRSEVKTLSQGEMRALYLLNFIFEVEARKRDGKETLFIIDDVADSFDYKNKHAIVQYLNDLTETEYFYQIILTHNFDFFRSLTKFVGREHSLMVSRTSEGLELHQAKGVDNPFTKMWKPHVSKNDVILCATIPFTRNLIEYTRGSRDKDYLTLTSMMHWKPDTEQLTAGDYLRLYNQFFGTNHETNRTSPIKSILFFQAFAICIRENHDGLNLADKILLSMAIRLKAEIFMTEALRELKGEPGFWCSGNNQFGRLINEYRQLCQNKENLQVLDQVSVTVSSNIHLNSFMYEPILDLTIDHLAKLYDQVSALEHR